MKNSYLSKAIQLVWKHARWWFIVTFLLSLLTGMMPLATLWVLQEMITSVSDYIQDGTVGHQKIVLYLVLQFALSLAGALLGSIQRYLDTKVELQLNYELQKIISTKTANCPMEYFDIPAFHHHLDRVQGNTGFRFLSPLREMFQAGSLLISIGSYVVYLLTVHWVLALISLLAAVPYLVVQARFGNQRFQLTVAQTPTAREAQYLSHLLTDRQGAKEIRLFGLWQHLLLRFTDKYFVTAAQTLRLLRRQQVNNLGLEAVTSLFYSGAALFLLRLIGAGGLEVGQFVAIGQAVQGTQNMVNQLSAKAARMYEEFLFIRDFYQFLEFEVEELIAEKPQASFAFPVPLQKGIEVENLSFRYPLSSEEMLRNVSFRIHPGEKVAIVGHNGSGKTTLVKCLMGLYAGTGGRILFDGIDMREIEEQDLRRRMTVIFQDFMKYALSVRENIRFGDIERPADDEGIREAAKRAGADVFVEKMKDGYDTYLSRLLADGEDLSGGQWQKIALARALFRDGEVILFDEPTAALDPLAEMEVFRLFNRLTENKSAVFISHRMSAAKMADRILVMKEGQLIENGSHEELLALGGEYAAMYEMQAQWFAEGEPSEDQENPHSEKVVMESV